MLHNQGKIQIAKLHVDDFGQGLSLVRDAPNNRMLAKHKTDAKTHKGHAAISFAEMSAHRSLRSPDRPAGLFPVSL